MQRGRKADDATSCRRSTSGPAAKPSTKCICDIYIYAVYIYIQILDSLRQADLSGRHQPFFMLRVRLICEIVRVIAWQLYISVTIDSSLARFAATQLSIFRQMRVNGLTEV